MNDLISVYDQMSCKLLHTEKSRNASLSCVPYMELLCLPSKQLESGTGGKQAATKTHKENHQKQYKKSETKKNRENFVRSGVQVGLSHAQDSSSLSRQHQLEGKLGFQLGNVTGATHLAWKTNVLQYFVCSVGHKDDF